MSDKTIIPAWIGRRWRLVAGALAAALAVVMVALVVLVQYQRNEDLETRKTVARSYVLRAHMQHVFSLVQDVETGARGFMLTGEAVFLEPYDRARAKLPNEMAQLRASALHAPDRVHADRMEILVRRKLQIAARNVALRRGPAPQTAALSVRDGQGRKVM
ncbi:MAG TPA: CHASE3 domain-containing protein, partial [Caulobacteraceae bacterium]|nr:CHASE3 domain-containing protein [Caulobacteraceae bacterium]